MMSPVYRFAYLASFASFAFFALSSCRSVKTTSGSALTRDDFVQGRIVDVSSVKKQIGSSRLLIFKKPKYGYMLEGYIRGIITDYDHRPIEGVIVRAVLTEAQRTRKKKADESSALLFGEEEKNKKQETLTSDTPNFDAGITDADGIYRVRFSFPIVKGVVDVKGRLMYNPGWAQQHDVLGQSYEPQAKESDFRLYYSKKQKLLIFSEGVRANIVRPVRNVGGKLSPVELKGSNKPETAAQARKAKTNTPKSTRKKPAQPAQQQPSSEVEDDFFKGFNFGP